MTKCSKSKKAKTSPKTSDSLNNLFFDDWNFLLPQFKFFAFNIQSNPERLRKNYICFNNYNGFDNYNNYEGHKCHNGQTGYDNHSSHNRYSNIKKSI